MPMFVAQGPISLPVGGVAVDSNNGWDESASVTWSFPFTNVAGNAMVVMIVSTNPEVNADSVTYNSVPMTLIGGGDGGTGHMQWWGLLNPATGNHDVAMDFTTAGANGPRHPTATTFTGAYTGGTVSQTFHDFVSDFSVGATSNAVIPVSEATGLVISSAMCTAAGSPLTYTAPADFVYLSSETGHFILCRKAYAAGTGSSVTFTDAANPTRGIFGCAIKPA